MNSPNLMQRLSSLSPLLADLSSYKPEWFSHDLIAGLSIAAVQVPTAVAYAQLAGFSPEIGLYASILPVIVYAFLGSSKQLVVGPDAATCTMVASVVAPLAGGDTARYIALSSMLSLLTGILMIVCGTFRMGFIVNFFSRPILIGFLNGIALSIIVGQTAKMLGIVLKHNDFFEQFFELCGRLSESNLTALSVGAACLLILALLKRFAPRVPASLIALVLATAVLALIGTAVASVALVGKIPGGLPHLSWPTITYHHGKGLLANALGLVVVSFTSGMLTARSFASRSGTTLDANKEMLALGAADMAAGFSGSFAITGADSRTAVSVSSGSKTQLASVFSALAVAAVAAWLSNLLAFVPLCALAAVLIFSAFTLIDVSSYKELNRIDKFEFRLSLLTTIAVLALGVLAGVAFAIALALILVMKRIYKPEDSVLGKVPGLDGFNDIALSAKSEVHEDMILWRFDGPLVFFNADYFKARLNEIVSSRERPPKWLILSMESVTQIDSTGFKILEEIYLKMQEKGIQILFARPKMFMRGLHASSANKFGQHVFPTIQSAVDSTTHPDGFNGAKSFKAFYEQDS